MPNTGHGVLTPLTGYGWQCVDVSGATFVTSASDGAAGVVSTVSVATSVELSTSGGPTLLISGVGVQGVGVGTITSVTDIIYAVARTLIEAGYSVPAFEDVAEVWVIDPDTKAVSRYVDYAFNSFSQLDGRYIAAKSDGLYLLDEVSADGPYFLVDLGTLDFGSSALKHVPNVYLGVSARSDIYLRVMDGAETYTYKARAVDVEQQTQRFDVGKGLRATHFDFVLVGNSAAELVDVEFVVVATKRRI